MNLLFPLAVVFVIFWLLVFRPESRKRKERERLIASVKKGDQVVTSGGMLARVWRVDANEVVVVIDKDKDVKARFTKNAILDIVPAESTSKAEEGGRGADASQGDAKKP